MYSEAWERLKPPGSSTKSATPDRTSDDEWAVNMEYFERERWGSLSRVACDIGIWILIWRKKPGIVVDSCWWWSRQFSASVLTFVEIVLVGEVCRRCCCWNCCRNCQDSRKKYDAIVDGGAVVVASDVVIVIVCWHCWNIFCWCRCRKYICWNCGCNCQENGGKYDAVVVGRMFSLQSNCCGWNVLTFAKIVFVGVVCRRFCCWNCCWNYQNGFGSSQEKLLLNLLRQSAEVVGRDGSRGEKEILTRRLAEVFKLRCESWVVQIEVLKSGCSNCGDLVDFLVSIHWWSKPPHHVKVNPLGEGKKIRPPKDL